ncbi:SDR family NAD(P)-dependent oxidoreductase [Leadbetterella sp. DM7]|uniref:SDR family NAD(P)-dependent oxidoreductase n=1 Tax=Leadbetterella sp. DM7 TaxID=3235085 RepID=UPI00349E7309
MSRTALITGASSGIGAATARALASSHIHLVICGRRAERLEALKQELEPQVKVHTLIFDVADFGSVKNAIDSLPEEFAQIDILVNNAGNAHGLGAIQDGDLDDWTRMINSNVIGLLNVSKCIMKQMTDRGSGHIVNISSVAGKHVYENGGVYCATKHSVEAISEAMRKDMTAYGVKVTNIAPGAVETEFSLVRFKGDEDRAGKVYEGFEPLQARDIADAIAYCVNAPDHVTIADMTIYARAQSYPNTIYRKPK